MFDPAFLALKALREAQLLRRLAIAWGCFEQNLATFAKTDFRGIHNPSTGIGRYRDSVHQHKQRLGKVHVEQRLRRRKLENLSPLKQPVKTFLAEFEEFGLNSF